MLCQYGIEINAYLQWVSSFLNDVKSAANRFSERSCEKSAWHQQFILPQPDSYGNLLLSFLLFCGKK